MKNIHKTAAAVLIGAFAFSLAACGNDDPGDKSKPLGPDPNSVKTEQVTEAQWKSAFGIENEKNLSFLAKTAVSVAGKTDEQYTLYKYNGNKVYLEEKKHPEGTTVDLSFVTEKTYWSIQAGNATKHTQDGNDWLVVDVAADTVKLFDRTYPGNIAGLAEYYSSFTYDESKNAYVASRFPGTEQMWNDVRVKITGGKLAVVYLGSTDNSTGVEAVFTETYQFYDYGTMRVDIPFESDDIMDFSGEWRSDGERMVLDKYYTGVFYTSDERESACVLSFEGEGLKVTTEDGYVYSGMLVMDGNDITIVIDTVANQNDNTEQRVNMVFRKN